MEALVGLFLACVGEGEGEQGGFELRVPQGALDEAGIDAGFQPMGSIGMSLGRAGDAHFGDTGALLGFAEGALDTGATHRGRRCRPLDVIAPGGGKEPGGVPRGCPGGAEQHKGLGGQGDGPVFGALATMAMDLEALTIDVRDLRGESRMEPEAQAIDGGQVDLVVQGGGYLQEPLDLLHTEDGGEPVGGLRTQECKDVPVAREDVLIEKADATGADTHGRGGEAVDIFPVQEVVLDFLFRDAVGRCVIALREQADVPDRGLLGPCALATELESRNHVLTQWGHERSPSMS
jgi:hypothetical protein